MKTPDVGVRTELSGGVTVGAKSRPTVMFVIHGLGIGGAEKQLVFFLTNAPPTIDVHLICLTGEGGSGDLMAKLRQHGIHPSVIDRTNMSFAVFFLRLYRQIRAVRPDLVHTFLAGSAGTWGRLAAWLARVPSIFHSDRSLRPPTSPVQQKLRPLLDLVTRRFMPNGRAIADWLVSSGVDAQRIVVVQNGVNIAHFRPMLPGPVRAVWGIPGDALVAGMLGRMRPEKRHDLYLDALLRLPVVQRPDYVIIGGDGPLFDQVRQQIMANTWLSDHCRLVGNVHDVPSFLSGLDYLVLCSDREGMPNVVLEAMAMEKPIVATRIADLPELIRSAGMLAEPGNAASLAVSIRAMHELTAQSRAAMGRAGRERILAEYGAPQAAEKFWALHLEVLK